MSNRMRAGSEGWSLGASRPQSRNGERGPLTLPELKHGIVGDYRFSILNSGGRVRYAR